MHSRRRRVTHKGAIFILKKYIFIYLIFSICLRDALDSHIDAICMKSVRIFDYLYNFIARNYYSYWNSEKSFVSVRRCGTNRRMWSRASTTSSFDTNSKSLLEAVVTFWSRTFDIVPRLKCRRTFKANFRRISQNRITQLCVSHIWLRLLSPICEASVCSNETFEFTIWGDANSYILYRGCCEPLWSLWQIMQFRKLFNTFS